MTCSVPHFTLTGPVIIIFQVRESASSKRSQVAVLVELAHGHDYSLGLLLLTALMHLMLTFIEESLCLCNLRHDAQKHCAVGVDVVGRSRIKHVTQKEQDVAVGGC